jgi:hypothetical protein
MANFGNNSTIQTDDQPVAVRIKRSISLGPNLVHESIL